MLQGVDAIARFHSLDQVASIGCGINKVHACLVQRDRVQGSQNADIVHQEYRDDRYVAALAVPAHEVRHLLYLARAVTPGRYVVPPAQVESMYRPEWQAYSDTPEVLQVKAR